MRLSPLSVPYRVVEKGISLVFTAAFLVFSGAFAFTDDLTGPLLAVGALGLLVLALVGYELAYYRRYEYELTPDTFDIRSGVVSRRNREIPLRRIQNVDIQRNVAQRVLGIAALNFETAGGSETEAAIRFVTFEEAKRLQREISRLKRGIAPEAPDEPPAEGLFALSPRELALVGLLSFDLRVPGALFFLVSGSVPVVSPFVGLGSDPALVALGGVALVLFVALGSWLVGAAVAVVNYYGFALSRTTDELQYERGLLRRYDGSIPFDKVQTLTIEDNPLKRRFGYATLAIETAGYAPGQGGEYGSQAAVPIARRDRVARLANALEPFGEPSFERPPKRVRRRYAVRYLLVLAVVTGALYAIAVALDGGTLSLAPGFPWYLAVAFVPLAPVAAHYKWKHRGVWLGENHVVTRNGFWTRETKAVPYLRIQTVIDRRTIFQRRWRLATVTVDTAGSLSLMAKDAAAVDVDERRAGDLREALDRRLHDALVRRRGGSAFVFGNVSPAEEP
ncbi:PH domain-containing protein [Halegenticoccus tardaugens]|uniref:PH domain-containing protein n=1 Tax=Halegenticoccus tardaugens TaxID=2071624 RepID=UPI00100A4E4F|nr:PH domain-containing protein [Halegenticoccus tardaugens]